MSTYKLEPADLSDFYEMNNKATESGKPDYEMFKDAVKSRLVIDGETIVLAGYQDMDLPDEEGNLVRCRVLAAMFRRDVGKHTRAVVEGGREYMKQICGTYPVVAIALENNEVFKRFLTFMGFKDTEELERNPETGIMYHVYMRL